MEINDALFYRYDYENATHNASTIEELLKMSIVNIVI